MKKFIVVVPARLKSTRLPEKPLVDLCGKSMIQRTYEQCLKAVDKDLVYVATDHELIVSHCKERGMNVLLTSDALLTGTDRVAEVAGMIEAEYYINVQGDEPLFNPADLVLTIEGLEQFKGEILNGFAPIDNEQDYRSLTIPKVVARPDGRLLYMSRSAIPGNKQNEFKKSWRQICVYAFPKEALLKFSALNAKTELENEEDIEILRFMELGYEVRMLPMSADSIAVDTPEDVERVCSAIKKKDPLYQYDTLLWDFDGVILDSMSVREMGFTETLKDFDNAQVESLLQFHRRNGGLSRYVKFRHFYEEILKQEISDERLSELCSQFSKIMLAELKNPERLIHDSVAYIKQIARDKKMHIVSGSDGNELRELCKALGLTEFFISIEGSPTPKKKLVADLLAKHGYQHEKTVLIGDSMNDYEAADENGIHFIGYNSSELKAAGLPYMEAFSA